MEFCDMNLEKVWLACLLSFCVLKAPVLNANAQEARDPNERVMQAAECIRKIPGMIEGESDEDLRSDNAHFAVLSVRRGRLGFEHKILRFHPGVPRGMFPNIDSSRVGACLRGMSKMPRPNR